MARAELVTAGRGDGLVRKANRPKVHVACPNCGKEELVYVGRAETYVACSKKCRAELAHKKRRQVEDVVPEDVWREALRKPWLS